MSALHEAFGEIVADVPEYGDLDRAIEQADQERRRRYGAAAGLFAAAAVIAVIVGVLAITRDWNDSSQPIGKTPTPTPTQKHSAIESDLHNGRITSAGDYLGKHFAYDWRDFDPASGTGLVVTQEGLAVLGATGPVATLTCGGHLRCGAATFERVGTFGRVATLGPGADEVTVARGPRTLQVIGYDGALRQTIDLDLPASVSYGAGGRQLAWTPDGSRLAVVTGSYVAMNDVWLVDRSGEAQHAYRGRVWSLGGWSPDGQSLLLDIDARPRTGGHYSGSYGADVVVLRQAREGSSPALTPLTLYHSNRHFDWAGNVAWSPDGTRIAVRTGGSIVEISADNGSVIAEHPHDNGWLIWPARAG